MLRPVLFAIAVVALVRPAPAAPVPATDLTGNWILSTVGPGGETAQCILKFESKDGKPTASVVFAPEGVETTVTSLRSSEGGLAVTVKQVRMIQGQAAHQRV